MLVLLASLGFIGHGLKDEPDLQSEILLYSSLAVIVSITIIGCFIVLLNVLKIETEEKKMIMKVESDCFKELQMTRIAEAKEKDTTRWRN